MRRTVASFLALALLTSFALYAQDDARTADLEIRAQAIKGDSVTLPAGVVPLLYFSTPAQCSGGYYYNDSIPPSVVGADYACEGTLTEQGGVETTLFRFSVYDLREGHDTRVLFVVEVRDGATNPVCTIWFDEGFWSGREPSGKFSGPVPSDPCLSVKDELWLRFGQVIH